MVMVLTITHQAGGDSSNTIGDKLDAQGFSSYVQCIYLSGK